MSNHRLTVASAIAVLAAALSLYSVLKGNGWMAAAIGATVIVAIAGTLTRLATIPAAIAATVVVLIAFVPPLAGHGWPGRIAALLIVAITAASATGARLPRSFAAPATYVGCLLLYLNLVFARGRAFGAIIPSARSVAALAGLPSLASGAYKYSPPITATKPVEFIAAAGIGATAILVDLLAVRLRRPAIAGLPLLLLFSVPVASSLKAFDLYQTLTFALAIAAYLALLSADGKQRLRMWGRLVTIRRAPGEDEAGAGPDTRDLAASGRRVGLAAVCLAIIVPIVLVGSKPHDLFKRTDYSGSGLPGFSGSGGQVMPLLKITQLLDNKPVQVLRYNTDATDAGQNYLQVYVLTYDPRTDKWLTVRAAAHPVLHQQLAASVPGLAATTPVKTVQTKMDVYHFQAGPLPIPYAPAQISIPGRELTESAGTLMVFDKQNRSNLLFDVTSTVANPTKYELSTNQVAPNSITKAFGGYTGPDMSKLQKIAQQVTNGAATNLRAAVDLQNWFQSRHFSYTTRPNLGNSAGWLLQFLTHYRRGDCEQFAPAFAILARLIGIPSRVVVGYTAGTQLRNGTWQVTTADAHAWPELYFPNVGWVRFEPTPAAPNDQGTASLPLYTKGVLPGPQAVASASASASSSAGSTGKRTPGFSKKLNFPTGGVPGATGPTASGQQFPVGLAVGLAILLLLVSPAVGRWITSRRRWLAASGDAALAHAAWRELTDYLTDYGLPGPPSESPRTTAARVANSAGPSLAVRDAVRRIGAAEERAQYSLGTLPGAGLRSDVLRVRKGLAATCSWPQRLRALLLPPSTMAAVRVGLQSANHALSWLDSPLPSMRRRAGRLAPRQAR